MGGFTQALLGKMQEKQKQYQDSYDRQIKYYESVQSDPNATPDAKKAAVEGLQATQYAMQHNKPKSMAAFYGNQLSELGGKLTKFGLGKGAKGKKGDSAQGEKPAQPQQQAQPQAPAQQGGPAQPAPDAQQAPQRPPNQLPGPPVKQHELSKVMHGVTRGLATVGGVGLQVAGGVLQGASRVANGPERPAPPMLDPAAMQTYGPGEAEAKLRQSRIDEIKNSPDLSPEEKHSAIAKMEGANVYESFTPMPGTKPQKIGDKWMQMFKDKQGNVVWHELPAGYEPPKGKGLKFDDKTDEVIDQDTGKRYTRDAKDAPEEVSAMFKGQKTAEERKTQNAMRVAYARGEAMAGSRVIQVIDPSNPEEVTFMKARDAVSKGAHSPAGIAFQVDKSITKAFTSGKPAENINYFNTAIDHLKVLKEAAAALNNNDYPAFNRLANRWATATGQPAPTNLDAVRNAVAGEISKTFKGTGATNEEVDLINTTIHNAQSPDQITGAADTYIRLMDGKVKALKNQFEKGKQGKPNFPGSEKAAPSGKVVSLKAAMALPQNKGKSEAEVRKDIESHGHKVVE